jgi:hypothetical protein
VVTLLPHTVRYVVLRGLGSNSHRLVYVAIGRLDVSRDSTVTGRPHVGLNV